MVAWRYGICVLEFDSFAVLIREISRHSKRNSIPPRGHVLFSTDNKHVYNLVKLETCVVLVFNLRLQGYLRSCQ